MNEFLTFFETMPAWQKLAWIVGCLWFSWSLEGFIPLFKLQYHKWKHAWVNLVFLATTVTINLLFGLLTVGLFNWISTNKIGLLYLFDLPIWAELIIAVMALDLIGQYWVHYLLHKYKWMWKFHMIHHSDSKVDVTTGTRHHPGDYFMRETFALLAIVLAGAPFAYYVIYRITTIFFTYLTHANISVPYWLDKALSLVFISPNMHKFHHHFERPWTNSNYGNIFSLWDRIFGTFVYDDLKKIKYGLDVLDEKLDQDIVYQLKIPFDKKIKTDY
jgi:sterol desaturase/sphingolipid hydroxylase (fatty acid hydroxylase superfamily)